MLEEFVGVQNIEPVNTLISWLQEFYNDFCYAGDSPSLPKYAIIFSQSGNGKTYLAQELAKRFDAELFWITPDIESQDMLNNIVKSINMNPLEKKRKLILVDDIDEFSSKYQDIMIELPEISTYPIIYTSTSFSLPSEFIAGGLRTAKNKLLKLVKPLASELLAFLEKKNLPISAEVLKNIAIKSQSFRSAVLALYNHSANEMLNHEQCQTKAELLNSIKSRQLKVPLVRENIHTIFRSIKGYDADTTKVIFKFADFDFRIKYKYEEINPIFINEMLEPIQNIEFNYQFNNKKKHEKKAKKQETKKEQEKTVSVPTSANIDAWL